MLPSPVDAPPLAPGAPDPSLTEGQSPLVTIPLSEEDLERWKGELTRSEKQIERVSAAWDRNMKAYAPDPTNAEWGTEVNPGVDFYQVEQKKGQLFFDTPTVIFTPEPDADPKIGPAIAAEQARMNRTLSRKKLDAKRLMDKVLFDVLCPAALGCTKIGYTNISKPSVTIDPVTQQPKQGMAPVFTEFFWERFSPKKLRKPANFHDTEFDKAPWLGMRFVMPLRAATRLYQLPKDFKQTVKKDKDLLKSSTDPAEENDEEQVTGTALEYKASLYDDAELHPQKLRELVLIDGMDEPAVHRDSPHQTFGDDGTLTPDSVIGFSIRVCTIRDLADSAFPPSDCTISRPLVNELALFRTQLTQHRDSSTSIRLANGGVITKEILNNVVRGPFGTIIIIPEASYDPGRPPVMEVAHPVYSRENFTAQDKIEADISKVNALSANQVGTEQDTVRSATELTYVQRNSDVRLQAEKNRVTSFFLGGVQYLDTLHQRYPENGQKSPALGRYSYDIKPDSGVHVDAAADRKFAMERYNFFAKAPNVNQQYLLSETARLTHLDPDKLFQPPAAPHPAPPKISFIVKGDDLNPLAPQYPNMVEALKEAGITLTPTQITDQLVSNAAMASPLKQPVHPGAAPMADKVNQHQADQSGQQIGLGGLAGAHA